MDWWIIIWNTVHHVGSLSSLGYSILGLPVSIICLHLTSFRTRSSVTPTLHISSFTISKILLCELHFCVLAVSSTFNIPILLYPLSLLITCADHLNLESLALPPNCLTWPVLLRYSFLILLLLVIPSGNLSIFNSTISPSVFFIRATVPKTYINSALSSHLSWVVPIALNGWSPVFNLFILVISYMFTFLSLIYTHVFWLFSTDFHSSSNQSIPPSLQTVFQLFSLHITMSFANIVVHPALPHLPTYLFLIRRKWLRGDP